MAVVRDCKLFHLSIRLATLGVIIVSSFANARPPSKSHKTFYDYLTSTDFDCTIDSTRVLPRSNSAPSACLVNYSCQPKPGVEARSILSQSFCETTSSGMCEEPIDCARSKSKSLAAKVITVSATSEHANNKFNDLCWEAFGPKDRRAVLQVLQNGAVAIEACVTAFICKARPVATSVACSPIAVAQGGSKECPQLNDCINEDISLPGYTDSQFQKLSSAEQERIRKLYEQGETTLSELVSKTVPRTDATNATINHERPSDRR